MTHEALEDEKREEKDSFGYSKMAYHCGMRSLSFFGAVLISFAFRADTEGGFKIRYEQFDGYDKGSAGRCRSNDNG